MYPEYVMRFISMGVYINYKNMFFYDFVGSFLVRLKNYNFSNHFVKLELQKFCLGISDDPY